MKYRKLGRTAADKGTMHFDNKTDEKEAFEIMDKALDYGLTRRQLRPFWVCVHLLIWMWWNGPLKLKLD